MKTILFRVYIGRKALVTTYSDRAKAATWAASLRTRGFDAWVAAFGAGA